VLPVEGQDAEHTEAPPPAEARRRPLLIAGIPRSGSSWTQVILSRDPSVFSVTEPDSETKSAPAIWAKRRLGRYPVLAPGARDADYEELWRWVLAGAPQGRRLEAAERVRKIAIKEWRWYVQGRWTPTMRLAGQLGRHPGDQPVPELRDHRLLVKSVHAAMSVEWLAATFDIEVLILLRHPGAVLASWQNLGLPEHYAHLERVPEVRQRCEEWGVPLPGSDELEHAVWLLGVLLTSLEQAARRSGFVLRTHEQMCVSPAEEFRSLYRELGLEWTDRADEAVEGLNRPGQGWSVERVAKDQPDLWKTRLSPATVEVMQRVLAPFPFRTWTSEDLQLTPGQ
jgi:Sulfotransferase family